jgi:hypothetical protein
MLPNCFVHNERVRQIAVAFKDVRDKYTIFSLNLQEGIDVKNPKKQKVNYSIEKSDIIHWHMLKAKQRTFVNVGLEFYSFILEYRKRSISLVNRHALINVTRSVSVQHLQQCA